MTERHDILPSVVRHDMRNGVTRHELLTAVVRHEIGTPNEDAPTAPVFTVDPAVTGDLDWGATLTCDTGTAPGADSFTYQWERFDPSVPGGGEWSDITGETANTYVSESSDDYPGGVRCRVTATNAAGSSSADSNTVSSPIADAIAANPDLVWWLYDKGQSVATGNAMATWHAHNADDSFDQSTASERPTYLSSGVDFDGISHNLRGGATVGALLEDACTVLIGFDGIDDTVTTSVRTFLCAATTTSGGVSEQLSANYSRPDAPNATRQRFYTHDGSSSASVSLQDLAGVGADGYNFAMRCAGRGVSNGQRCDELVDPLDQVGSTVTRPGTAKTYAYCVLGARAVGPSPTISQYWQGVVRYLAIGDVNASDGELDTIRDALASAGYTGSP